MKIKSIKNFRWHYKTQVRKRNDRNTNTNFVGVYHDVGEKRTNGYFELTHGDKKIHKFLPSILKIAEDGQAIYEFIQNAVDCNSSQFFIFYNDKYFLAVNNGKPFNHRDVLSILNIADTTKDYSCDNIGRFGIGFKLVHRLVGKDEGIKELVEDYKGPVIYSWNNIGELKQLLGNSPVFPDFVKNPTNLDDIKSPWLFKIIATNFPTEPGEKVLDINYNEKVLFPYSELKEIIEYLKENFKTHQGRFDFENLEQGSLFFLKLGEGKRKLLDNDYKGLENGVQYSMNFLKNLEEVYINDNSLKKRDLKIQEFVIQKGSDAFNEINPEYANCDIIISFGYTDYKRARGIRKSPNFYKYFPMGDETNGFSFILHCDSFDIEANRRKLHDSNKNRKLFPQISKSITQYADELKERDFDEFLNLYSNLLVSRIPYRDNNKWLYNIFFENLLNYIQTNIPIKKGTSELKDNVKIKDISFDIHLPMLGLDEIEWFYWENKKENEYLIEEAENSDKLSIEKWDITNIFIEADLEKLDNWIKQLSNSYYNQFIKELESHYYSEKTIGRLIETELFKFSDDNFYSINQINGSNNLIVFSKKTSNIKAELLELGFIISELDFSKYKFYEKISQFLKSDKSIFEEIASRTEIPNNLSPNQKNNLFGNFISQETKFIDVGEESLKQFKLFVNTNNEIRPLKELLPSNLNIPIWLNVFKISSNEYKDTLDKYLLSETDIYNELILNNWDLITSKIKQPVEFYEKTQYYFSLKEFNPTLSNQNFIYSTNNDGNNVFIGKKEVYFNDNLQKVVDYESFQNAIFSLTELQIPHKEILPFLLKEPFYLKNALFCNQTSENTILSKNQSKALLDFCISNNEQFFEKYIIEENENDFNVSKSENNIYQYFTQSNRLKDFISNNLSDKLRILPSALFDYRSLVLKDSELESFIVDNLDTELFEEEFKVLSELLSGERFDKLLDEVEVIEIKNKAQYLKDDFEYKFIEKLKEKHFETVKEKIVIKTDTNDFKLSETSPTNEISFDNGKYKLLLSDIIDNQYFANTSIIESFISIINETGIDENKLSEIFRISEELTNGKLKEILNDLLSSENHTLKNNYQFAFILLYNNFIEPINFDNINIYDKKEETQKINYSWYSNNFSFISLGEIISERYAGLNKLLKLSKNKPYLLTGKDCKIIFEPYFDKENQTFFCEYLKDNLSEIEKVDLLNLIYDYWKQSIQNKRDVIAVDWSKIYDKQSDEVLGFNPNDLVSENNIVYEDEVCPPWLLKWISEKDNGTDFIADFGVNTNKSEVSVLRKLFLSNKDIDDFSLENISDLLLENTLNWIVQKEIKISNKNQFTLLEKIAEKVNIDFDEKEDIEKLNEKAILFNEVITADYYSKWSDEFGYTINFFEGEIPYNVLYEETVLWNYTSGNIIEIDDVIFLNKEKFNNEKSLLKINSEENTIRDDAYTTLLEYIIGSNLPAKSSNLPDTTIPDENDVLPPGSGLDSEERAKRAREYKDRVKQDLLSKGFNVDNWTENYAHIMGVVDPKGNEVELLVKGAKGGKIFISPVEWLVLSKPNSKLIAINSHNSIVNVPFEELMKPESRFHLEFKTETFSKKGIFEFAKVFQYVSDCKFIIDSPGFSYFDFMDSFGLSEKQDANATGEENDDNW